MVSAPLKNQHYDTNIHIHSILLHILCAPLDNVYKTVKECNTDLALICDLTYLKTLRSISY